MTQHSTDMRKLAAKRIPHKLIDVLKSCRVDTAIYLLNLFEPNGPKCLADFATGDETWI